MTRDLIRILPSHLLFKSEFLKKYCRKLILPNIYVGKVESMYIFVRMTRDIIGILQEFLTEKVDECHAAYLNRQIGKELKMQLADRQQKKLISVHWRRFSKHDGVHVAKGSICRKQQYIVLLKGIQQLRWSNYSPPTCPCWHKCLIFFQNYLHTFDLRWPLPPK